MAHDLDTIATASRALLGEQGWSMPVRKLAYTVMHGAEIIGRYRLGDESALPQFKRALFHLCRVTERPLCGQCTCLAHGWKGRCECFGMTGGSS